MHFDMKKPQTETEAVECKPKGDEEMDPIGYFLIRINNDVIEAGLCDYKNINVIKKFWVGKLPQDIYRQIVEDVPGIMRDHVGYLSKELTRAWTCMKLGVKYVQDGRMDGTFPEIEWLNKKDNSPK